MNRYKIEYDKLISYRINNKPNNTEYVEKHHIIPKSLGGTDSQENIVFLLAREHLHAHWLLYKHYEYENPNSMECLKMLCAVDMMIRGIHSKTIKRIDNITEYEYKQFQYVREQNCRKQVLEKIVNKNGSPLKGYKRLTNLINGKHKRVPKSKVQKYLNTGNWVLGSYNPEEMRKYLIPLYESVKKIGYLNTIRKFKIDHTRQWLRTMFQMFIPEYDKKFFNMRGKPDFRPIEEKINELNKLFELYKKYGFQYLKENNLYTHTKEMLLMLFRKHLPQYKYIQKDKNYTYEYAKKYYDEWEKTGYSGVVKKYNYKYSNAALLKMFYKFKLIQKN